MRIHAVEKYIINLDFIYFRYESELLTYQHSVIFRGDFLLWLEVISGGKKAQVIIRPCLRGYSSLPNCCVLFSLLDIPAKDCPGIKSQLFLILRIL